MVFYCSKQWQPPRTGGRPAVGFWSRPLLSAATQHNSLNSKLKNEYKAKKNKCYVSKFVTNWKTWPKYVFFFFLIFFPEQQTCQIWVGHSFEIWNLIFGWARYKTEHRVGEVCCSKCFIVFVIYFLVYFDKKVHKNLKKKIKQAKKFQTLDFAESNAHRKTNARVSFETYDLFFLA